MTALDILAVWKEAASTGRFYEEFERLTGFPEAEVRKRFGEWTAMTHETVDRIAEENGVTVREAGFQAYLADIRRIGHPRTFVYLDNGYLDMKGDPNPRAERPWPASDDCPSCPGRVSVPDSHKFGCSIYGARRMSIPVREQADGTFVVDGPVPKTQ